MCEIKIDELKFSSKVTVKCHRCAFFILNVLTESEQQWAGTCAARPVAAVVCPSCPPQQVSRFLPISSHLPMEFLILS